MIWGGFFPPGNRGTSIGNTKAKSPFKVKREAHEKPVEDKEFCPRFLNATYALDGDGNLKVTPLVACTTNNGALRPMTKTFRRVASIGLVEVHHMVMPPAEMN